MNPGDISPNQLYYRASQRTSQNRTEHIARSKSHNLGCHSLSSTVAVSSSAGQTFILSSACRQHAKPSQDIHTYHVDSLNIKDVLLGGRFHNPFISFKASIIQHHESNPWNLLGVGLAPIGGRNAAAPLQQLLGAVVLVHYALDQHQPAPYQEIFPSWSRRQASSSLCD